jgi:hypothetical protein
MILKTRFPQSKYATIECMRKPEFGKKNPVKSKLVTCDQMCVTLKHEWKKKLLKLYAQLHSGKKKGAEGETKITKF